MALFIIWRNVALFAGLHILAGYGFLLLITEAKWLTVCFACFMHLFGGMGVTAGAHRLWAHRSYKAAKPLRTLLMLMNCSALQNDIITWSRDHRCHHKWSDSSADPHDSRRGLLFSHIGWLCCKKHPEVIRKGQKLDLSDLYADPVLVFQKRHYKKLSLLFCFVLPTLIPVCLWSEGFWTSFLGPCLFRFCFTLNATWTVNSLAHAFGSRPYNPNIPPAQNLVCNMVTIGEGFHNYHHCFPQDYRASEFPWLFNISTLFIDAMSCIGWAYECKTARPKHVSKRKEGTP